MKKNPARNVHLKKGPSKLLEAINTSIDVDQRLYKEDIEGSIAHTKMLMHQKIISKKDQTKIISGLKKILKDIEAGKVTFKNLTAFDAAYLKVFVIPATAETPVTVTVVVPPAVFNILPAAEPKLTSLNVSKEILNSFFCFVVFRCVC